MNKLSVSDALNLAVGLANFTAAMWGLYCTIVVGLLAWVATLAGAQIKLPLYSIIVISVVWTAVTILNALSINKHNEEVNSLLNYIAKQSGGLGDTIQSIKVTRRAMLLHFVCWPAVMILLWTNLYGGSAADNRSKGGQAVTGWTCLQERTYVADAPRHSDFRKFDDAANGGRSRLEQRLTMFPLCSS